MAGENNKIMTVSYGTFSCTLEGFDDPFGTMREMAEYFRDLAAQDRFFGAEPLQPDVDTLHRIAEQTVQQRITSEQVSQDNLVLRQDDAQPQAAQPQAAQPVVADPAPVTEPHDTVQSQPTPEAEPEPEPAPKPAPATEMALPLAAAVAGMPSAGSVLNPSHSDTVAEKLQRIRSVVRGDATPSVDYSEDEHANDFMARAGRTVSRPVAGMVSDAHYDGTRDHKSIREGSEPQDAQVNDIPDSEGDQLQDVARLSQGDRLDVDDEPFENDDILSLDTDENLEEVSLGDTAEDEALPDMPLVARNPVEVDEMSKEELFAANAAPTAEDANAPFAEINNAGALDQPATDQQDPTDDVVQATAEETEALRNDIAALNAVAEDTNEADIAEEVAEQKEPAPQSKLTAADSMMSDDFRDFREKFVRGEDTNDSGFAFPDEEDAKAKENADATAVNDSPSETTVEGALQEPEGDASKSQDTVSQDAVTDAVDHTDTRAAKQARRDALAEDEDSALERLMDATSSRLEDTEGSVRRASIAHLKAAVAATKADSSLVEAASAKEASEMNQYREDLARVVRPGKNRPSNSDTAPNANKPSPLVLVSEQRIDEPSDSDTDDGIRPRRVMNGAAVEQSSVQATANGIADFEDDTNIFTETDTESFVSYIKRHDATQLPDILEAAAAHYCFVEGVEQFTRPMLMRKVAAISPEREFSREEGLRSFGNLLREGKIVKDEDGKFVIATTSRFMQEERYVG